MEVARYQAFHATANFPGKCWNPPTFSNGRIYARSTSEAICLDASLPSTLKLLPPQFLSSTQIRLIVSTANGAPITPDRLGKIEVRATNALGASPAVWPKLNDPLVLDASGVARLTNTINPAQPRQFYRAVELQ
jgi:hypothetical protein